MNNRLIPFANCPNFRDMGGYANREGQTIKQGILFRSSHLASLSDAELDQLSGLGITAVYDLRRGSERKAYPNRLSDHIVSHEFEIDVGSTKYFFEQLVNGTATRESTHEMMRQSYGRYVTDMGTQFSRMLGLLARPEKGGVLLHCMVGKDRTGISIGLLLLALNFHPDIIIDDYVLSNDYYPGEKIKALLLKYLHAAGVGTIAEGAMEPFCSVHPDYIQAAFDAIDTEYGGTDSYFRGFLGLSDEQMQNLRTRFLSG